MAPWLNGLAPESGPVLTGLWVPWREGSGTVPVGEPLSLIPLGSISIPECLYTPAHACAYTCWGCVQCADARVRQLGGSGSGGTGWLSAEGILQKRGVGAGEPVRRSGRAGLALGILGTLRRKGCWVTTPASPTPAPPCFLLPAPTSSGKPLTLPISLAREEKSQSDLQTPAGQLQRGSPLTDAISPCPHLILEMGKLKPKRPA